MIFIMQLLRQKWYSEIHQFNPKTKPTMFHSADKGVKLWLWNKPSIILYGAYYKRILLLLLMVLTIIYLSAVWQYVIVVKYTQEANNSLYL